MPIYMDRHDVLDGVDAEYVAQLHQADLKVQHLYNCKGLTYWFDGKRKTAFCLVDAPDKQSIEKMHNHSHGQVPHRIIEVDNAVVESFLGRIEDPKKSTKTELNIINDPAFRTIMVIGRRRLSLKDSSAELDLIIQDHNKAIATALANFNGRVVKQRLNYFLTSFDSVTNAVLCALEILKMLNQASSKTHNDSIKLNIALSAGIPVTEQDGFFEDTVKMAERLGVAVNGRIIMSSEVKDLYESENLNIAIDRELVHALNPAEEKFVNMLMDYVEREWRDTGISADTFSKRLGYSKSQLYRKMISLTGKSPNSFIMEYRLNRALELLSKAGENISKVAFETGFNSPAYFSKCFQKTFGILPSAYARRA